MRILLVAMIIINTQLLYGQGFTYPAINKTSASIISFVPPGWRILDSAKGDLNKDGLQDIALILQHIDSVSLIRKEDDATDTIITQPRILAILFRDHNLFNLAEQSNTFIPTYDDPFADDPYQSITIKNGILQINFYWYPNSGNWFNSSIFKFRYQVNDFFLIGAVYEERNKATHEFNNYSYNFLTKKRILVKGSDYKKTKTTEIKSLEINNLKTITTLKNTGSWSFEDD